MLRDRPTIPMSRAFIREASRVKHLDHVNVIRLLAVHFRTNPLLMVFEFMPLGDLKALLRAVAPNEEGNNRILFTCLLNHLHVASLFDHMY